jgi:thiamine kinase-like enzyme
MPKERLSAKNSDLESLNQVKPNLQNVTKISNRYGVNARVFEAWSESGAHNFIKFGPEEAIKSAVENSKKVSQFISTPAVTQYELNGKNSFLISEFIDGSLLTDIVFKAEQDNDFEKAARIEGVKNANLQKMYESGLQTVDLATYRAMPAQRLFGDRMLGARFGEYYDSSKRRNIASLFGRHININEIQFKETPEEIIKRIQDKLKSNVEIDILAHLGHGDAHHQNVLVDSAETPYLIDLEYAGLVTPRMEMAKPYYNDLIGTLFYFFGDRLEKSFDIKSVRNSKGVTNFRIQYSGGLDGRIALAQNKIQNFEKLLDSNDVLTLNEYLLICHLTTRNPNIYSAANKKLFLALIPLLNSFNPKDPASLFDAFKGSAGK